MIKSLGFGDVCHIQVRQYWGATPTSPRGCLLTRIIRHRYPKGQSLFLKYQSSPNAIRDVDGHGRFRCQCRLVGRVNRLAHQVTSKTLHRRSRLGDSVQGLIQFQTRGDNDSKML